MILCIFSTAFLVCRLQYANAKKDLLTTQEEALANWVSGTTEAIGLWKDALNTQAKRVSSSELYRLFASDVAALGAEGSAINDVDVNPAAKNLDEGAAALAEQVPLMRNLLLDFMNFNGLSDARIVNVEGQTLLSALTRPSPVDKDQRETAERAITDDKLTFGPVRVSQSGLMLDYADPLQAVLEQDKNGAPVAALLLSMPVTGQIAQFLARDTRQGSAAHPRLLQKRGESLEELQVQSTKLLAVDPARVPLGATGKLAFGRRLALTGDALVYSLGDRIPGLNWEIILEVPASEVDARLQSQAWMIYGMGALVSVGVVLLFSLLWWMAAGREQRTIARHFESLYRVIQRQKQLLDSVNVSLDVGLLMADTTGKVQVCNRAFSRIVKRDESELEGVLLFSLFDTTAGSQLLEGIRIVVACGENSSLELALRDTGCTVDCTGTSSAPTGLTPGERLFRVTLFPFKDNDRVDKASGAVAIFQDITAFRRNSELRRQQQASTIAALVRAVESMAPHLPGHSLMMVGLADLVGKSLQLSEMDCNTVRTAASLSQLGKLFVPRALLSKTEQLTQEEQAELMRAPGYAYNVLQDIDFGLPVPEAVYEMSERMDGSGYPRKLQGTEISIHARMLAVLNSFCAMVSPRPYRKRMPVHDALE
ncbi:MAG: HD domain-containing phosphohydrolase, partial [Bilophila sp.]